METTKPTYSIPSIIALVAAILIFVVKSGPLITVLAIVAILTGIIGMMLSFAPSVRGGIASMFGIVAGLIGVIIAIAKLLGWIIPG